MVSDVGIQDVVLGVVLEEGLTISTLAGGLVLVGIDGVLHGDVRGSTETIVVVGHTRIVIVVVAIVGRERVKNSLVVHVDVVVVLDVVVGTEVTGVH